MLETIVKRLFRKFQSSNIQRWKIMFFYDVTYLLILSVQYAMTKSNSSLTLTQITSSFNSSTTTTDNTYNRKHVSTKRQSVICRKLYRSSKYVIISRLTNSHPIVYEDVQLRRFIQRLAMYRNSEISWWFKKPSSCCLRNDASIFSRKVAVFSWRLSASNIWSVQHL